MAIRNPTHRQSLIMGLLKDYSFNAMEVCRHLNGIDPKKFKGCYYQFGLARKGARCRFEERGCAYRSNSVDGSLRAMQKRGLIRSIKMRWFDGRNKGAFKNSLQLDVFRFYYLTKAGLAEKLKDDIAKHLLNATMKGDPSDPETVLQRCVIEPNKGLQNMRFRIICAMIKDTPGLRGQLKDHLRGRQHD